MNDHLDAEISMFNAADGWAAELLSQEAFNRGLMLNILFQERIATHATWLLNSGHLLKHLESNFLTLFEVACREGVIVPIYPDSSQNTIRAAIEQWLAKDGYTRDGLRMTNENEKIHTRIVRSIEVAEESGKIRTRSFPSRDQFSVGARYKESIGELLGEKRPWEEQSNYKRYHLDRIWDGTERWRKSIGVRLDDVEELSRRTLFKHLAQAMGNDVGDNFHNSKFLLGNAADAEERIAIEALVRWFAQTYAITLSEAIGISANFPVYDLDQDFVLDSIAAVHARPLDADPDISLDLELPPLDALLLIPPLELLAIRKDLGQEYFRAMRQWNSSRHAQRQTARVEVAEALQNYAARICEESDRRISVWVKVSGGSVQQSAETTLIVTKAVGSLFPIPLLGVVNSVGSLVLGVTKAIKDGHGARAGDRQTVRLEIDTKRHQPTIGKAVA